MRITPFKEAAARCTCILVFLKCFGTNLSYIEPFYTRTFFAIKSAIPEDQISYVSRRGDIFLKTWAVKNLA